MILKGRCTIRYGKSQHKRQASIDTSHLETRNPLKSTQLIVSHLPSLHVGVAGGAVFEQVRVVVGPHGNCRQTVALVAPAGRHVPLAEAEHVARVAVGGGVAAGRNDRGLGAAAAVVVPVRMVVGWWIG